MSSANLVYLWRRRRLYTAVSILLAGYYLSQGCGLVFAEDRYIVGGVYESIGRLAPGGTAASMRLIGGGFLGLAVAMVVALATSARWTVEAVWIVSTVVAVAWTTVFVVGVPLGWVGRATGPATYFWLYLGIHVAVALEPSVGPTAEA